MEFEEMQKIWDTQRQETLYAIDQAALHRRIAAKSRRAARYLNWNEYGLMLISVITGGVLLTDAIVDNEGVWDHATGAVFIGIAILLFVLRRQRLRGTPRYDRSLRGELEQARIRAGQLVRLNRGFQYWFLLPISVLTLAGMIWRGAPWWSIGLIAALFALAWGLARWELRCVYLPRQRELEQLGDLLTEPTTTV
jgi:hypothetical protein